jgi:hypothetical protein
MARGRMRKQNRWNDQYLRTFEDLYCIHFYRDTSTTSKQGTYKKTFTLFENVASRYDRRHPNSPGICPQIWHAQVRGSQMPRTDNLPCCGLPSVQKGTVERPLSQPRGGAAATDAACEPWHPPGAVLPRWPQREAHRPRRVPVCLHERILRVR